MNSPLQTFEAADKWLKSRVNLPTELNSAELALAPNFPAKVKAHCFFSAKVAEARILDRLREVSDSYSRGEINLAEARTRLKKFLTHHGYTADDVARQSQPPEGVEMQAWKNAKKLTNLASTARLNLILRQNAAMARAVGQHEVSMHPAIMQRFPYFHYLPSVSKVKRSSHRKFYNLVLPKTDPFWAAHTPPSDYGCNCGIEDIDAEEAKEFGGIDSATPTGDNEFAMLINGQPVTAAPAASGFSFNPAHAFEEFDMSSIKNIELRRGLHKGMLTLATSMDDGLTLKGAGAAGRGEMTVNAPDNVHEIRDVFQQVYDAAKAGKPLPDLSVSLGELLQEHADTLGIDPKETKIVFNSPGQKNKQGAAHWVKNHLEELHPDKAINLLERTVWNSASSIKENINKSNRRLIFTEMDGNAIATLRRKGNNWLFEIVSAWEPGEKYKKNR